MYVDLMMLRLPLFEQDEGASNTGARRWRRGRASQKRSIDGTDRLVLHGAYHEGGDLSEAAVDALANVARGVYGDLRARNERDGGDNTTTQQFRRALISALIDIFGLQKQSMRVALPQFAAELPCKYFP